MMINVLRPAGEYDCTNGGVSSKHDRLFVMLPHYPRDTIKPPEGVPVMILEQHVRGCLRLKPDGEKRWCMFGGNFGHTSDSRFWDAVEEVLGYRLYGAIAIHDRIES